jgi:hypothetical protein
MPKLLKPENSVVMSVKYIGVALIALGVLMMLYTGFTYITTKRVADIGPLKINKEEKHPVQWSPIVGALLFAGGIGLVASNRNKK